MFVPISIAKSPRIEPGAASSGFGRADHLARGPDRLGALEHHRDDRPGGDEVDELAEERALGVLGVVALGELPRDGHVAQRDDRAAPCARSGR